MAISQTKYVNIISAIGGTSQVNQRDLMGRVFTANPLIPAGSVVEFSGGSSTALTAVGNYFGTASDEYKFASKYFSYISRKGTMAQKISFAPHTTSATSARLYGSVKSAPLTSFTSLTNTDITFKADDTTFALSGLNLSAATSFTEVAEIIQEALDTIADETVSFEYNTSLYRFVFQTIATGADHTVEYATGTLASLFGMNEGNNGVILSDSSASETALQALKNSAELSNNFYSFTFLTSVSGEETGIAEWVEAQNVRYMWSLGVTTANAGTMSSSLIEYDGIGLTLDINNEHAEFLPMAIAGAINFDSANASVDFMYQQASGITPSVSSDTDASAYDAIRVNYYGSTQQAGNLVSFYQNGVLTGDITSMGVYVNEAWLKDAITTNLLNLRLSLDSLPANETGLGYVKLAIQEIIEKALFNGVISVGKTLDSTQKAYIAQLTGDSTAWQDIQSVGYWLTAKVVKYTEQGVEKYKVTYLLVYAKGDSINFVDGTDIMI
jgi:hypothetical protein